MKKQIANIAFALGMLLGVSLPGYSQQSPVLTNLDFTIVGVGLGVSPDYQAVPKGIASQVDTAYTSPGIQLSQEVLDQMPKDYKVTADLTGPAYQSPLTLTAQPGLPFKLPTLPLLGKYTLSNIRLLDGTGAPLFSASPQTVSIESIGDPLITNVTTRQLTLEEIQDRGVVVDSSNFTAYDFTVALGTQSNQVPISFPVIIPNSYTQVNPEELPPPTDLGIPPPVVSIPPPPELPANTSFEGFVLQADPEYDLPEEVKSQLPPIPGVVVIPNNIGFLNQYFSALLLVTNGAPGQSNLVVRDLKATISLPVGKDTQAGTSDDPLKMAAGAGGVPFPSELPVKNVGPDGKAGTQDDVSLLHPAESGQADFTIEGKKEGTHKIDFLIDAVLEGLPIGPVPIKGKASGAVLVRNPTFSITFSHPATIRSGEGYEIFVTVTNTSKTRAYEVTLNLDSQAMSGARMAPDETTSRRITAIEPGSSATISYRLIAQRTGKITASAIASDDNVEGSFRLTAGVGDRNIPLSPDSLIIPYTGALPPDLVNAAVGLLGQAWSVATAPAGALPADVLPIAKQVITSRANDLSEAGIRILMGDAPEKAVADLAFDFLGAENADRGFDDLRRKSAQGLNLDRAMAAVFRNAAQAGGIVMLQQAIAERATSRPGHISVVTSESPVRVMVTDGANNRTGGLAAGDAFREIPYAEQLLWTDGSNTQGARSTLSLVSKIESASYRVDLKADADTVLDLGIVVPDQTGTLRQVMFSGLSLPAGARAWVMLLPGTAAEYALTLDTNGDGSPDGSPVGPSGVMVVPDLGPTVVAVTQLAPGFGPGGDKHGRNVAVLFSERVDKEEAQNIANYSVDENAVRVSFLQPSGRMAFLLLRDGIGPYGNGPFPQRFLTVSGITDLKQNAMEPSSATVPITPRVAGPAAMVSGMVRSAQGEAVPTALVRLLQEVWDDDGIFLERRYVIFSEKQVKPDGSYQFDYVLQNDDPSGPFRIEAVNPANGESSALTTNVQYHGQQLAIDLFMKARGNVSGRVLDASGNGVANAAVLIKTLNDGRSYSATADATGGFSFTSLRVGPFSLKAVSTALSAEGLTMGTLPDDGGTAVQDVTIFPVEATPTGTIAGKVLESDGQTPRGGVIVIVNGQNYQNWTRTAVDGTYSFTGVFTGAVSISARDDLTGMNAVASGQVIENATSVFNIILKGMGTVDGLVQREDGLSPAGFAVIATGGTVQRLAVTDSEGRFNFTDMPTGAVTVRLPDPRNPSSTLATGMVTLLSAGDSASVLLWLPAKQLATGSITGTVKKRDGSVWTNAEVWLIVDPAAGKYKPYAAVNGTFTIPDPANPNDVLSLGSHPLVVREGAEIANATAQLWYDGQQAIVELQAAGIGTVSGTVRDEGSGSIPTGADVTLISTKPDRIGWLKYDMVRPVTVKSDPQTGVYTFPGVYAGSFTVSASNLIRPVPVAKSGAITSNNEVAVVDLLLKDTRGTISGTVLLPDGSPAADGVTLAVRTMSDVVTVSTDTAGLFHFPFVPAGNYEVIATEEATLRQAKASVAVPAGGDVPVVIRLLGKGGITVNVVDGHGNFVDTQRVSVKGKSFPNDEAVAVSDLSSGIVIFGNLSEGVYAVEAVDKNNLGGRTTVTIPADQAQVTATVTIADSGTVTGRFLKPDGKTPVGGGQITLKNSFGHVLAFTLTDAAGTFQLDHVPLGGFKLEGYDPLSDRRGVGGGTVSANDQQVSADVIVTPRGTVKGTVMNNGGTMPVEGASVSISVEGVSNWGYSTVTTPDGGFTFAGVPAGTITVHATANGLYGKATGALTYEGESVKTDIRLQATASITGTVYLPLVDATGQPIKATNTTVTVNGVTKQVDGSGTFLFTNLPVGMSYGVVARELGSIGGFSNRAGRATVTLTTDGETGHADVLLQGIGAVEGHVYEPYSAGSGTSAATLAYASVTLYASGRDGLVYDTMYGTSNEAGFFHFDNVPVGTFTLRATHPDRPTASSSTGSLNAEGNAVTVDLHLGEVGTVTGTVSLPGGAGNAAGGGVKYTGCGLVLNTTVGTDGRFLFENVPLCTSFDIYTEHAQGPAFGIGRAHGAMTSGSITDIGTIVLDDQAPAVAAVTPLPGKTDVPTGDRTGSPITVTFSEPMDRASVLSAVTLYKGAIVTSGTVTVNTEGTVATFLPAGDLSGFSVYTLVVRATARDLAQRPLAADFSSSFTTKDVTPPVVSSISPPVGAIQVGQKSVVRITFNEPISRSTITSVRLLDGTGTSVDVQYELTASDTVVVLTPLDTNGLQINTTYTISVAGVSDPSGNIIVPYTATFRTIDTIAPTVTGLTAAENADLIKGATVIVTATVADLDVSTVAFSVDDQLVGPGTKITPSSFTFPVTFTRTGEVKITAIATDAAGNSSVVTSASTIVVTVEDNLLPTIALTSPAAANAGMNMSVAVQTADDLAVREISLYSSGAISYAQTISSLSGKTYTANFSIAVPAGALHGTAYLTATVKDAGGLISQATATVLVQDTIAPTVSLTSPGQNYATRYKPGDSGTATVTASDAVGISMLVCTVTGSATGGGTFTFNPTEPQVSQSFGFTVSSGAAPNAEITLSCTAGDADGNNNNPPASISILVADTVRPTVEWTSIPNGATNVAKNAPINIQFSESMLASSVTATSVTLVADDGSGTLISGTIVLSTDRKIVIFTPLTPMAGGKLYKLTISAPISDDAGNTLLNPYIVRFTTSTILDSLQPQVVSYSPSNYATNVPLNGRIQVVFSKSINPATVVVGTSFQMSQVTTGVFSYSNDDTVMTFTPSTPLTQKTQYTIWINTGVRDRLGNALSKTEVFSFTTGTTFMDDAAPTVVDVSPMSGADSVPVNAVVSVRFSEPIAPTTVNNQTFVVSAGSAALPGVLSLDATGMVIRYKPANSATLAANTIYTITATTGLTDIAGNALVSEFASFFATGSGTDTVTPLVLSLTPPSGSQTLGLSDPVLITFTEQVNATTVNGETIWLSGGGVSGLNGHVPGTLSLSTDRKTAIFTPTARFFAGQAYSVNLSTGSTAVTVEDLAGNKMSGNNLFSLTTVTASGTDSAANLPHAATVTPVLTTLYANGLSTTTVRITNISRSNGSIVPDNTMVGVTAAPAFQLASKGGIIQGGMATADPRFRMFPTKGGAVNVTYQTPELPDLMPNETASAYIQVAALDNANNPMKMLGNATITLAHGNTAVVKTNPAYPTYLLAATGSTAEVTIVIKDNLGHEVAAGTKIGVTADPVGSFAASLGGTFVGGAVGLDTRYRIFETLPGGRVVLTYSPPTLTPGSTGYAAIQVASVDNNGQIGGLYSGYEFIYLSTGANPYVISPQPEVLTISPSAGSMNVPVNARITASFSQALMASSVTSTSFSLMKGGANVPGSLNISADGKAVTIVPSTVLDPNTSYAIYCGQGLRNASGARLLNPGNRTFTTGTGTATTAPAITGVTPSDGATDVGINETIDIQFNRQMNGASIVANGMIVSNNSNNVSGRIVLNAENTVATFIPDSYLDPVTVYAVFVSDTVTDVAGNALTTELTSTFTTATGAGELLPRVVSYSPTNYMTNVPLNGRIQVVFSKPIDRSTVNSTSFQMSPNPGGIISYSNDDTVLTFTPSTPFQQNTTYTVWVLSTAPIRDRTGNALYKSEAFSFTTGTTPLDSIAPTVVNVIPASGAENVPVSAVVSIQFNEPIAATTVNNQTVQVSSGGVAIRGELSLDSTKKVVQYRPADLASLTPNTIYTVTVTTGLTDLAGNPLGSEYSFFFKTGAAP